MPEKILKMNYFYYLTIICTIITFFIPSSAFCHEGAQYITKIDIAGCQGVEEDSIRYIIGIEEGSTLDTDTLRKGIKSVFRKGIFDDIMVTTAPHKKGIKITIYVVERPLIKDIYFSGNKNFSDSDLKSLFLLKEGQRLREEYRIRAIKELIMHYREKGFPNVHIDVTHRTDKKSSVSLEIKVHEGQPLIIRELKTSDEMKEWLSFGEGDIFDKEAIEKDMEKAQEKLKENGHYRPIVGPLSFNNGILEIPFEPGPVLIVTFKGNEAVDSDVLRKELPFMEGADVNEHLIKLATRRLITLYEKKGFQDTQVAVGFEDKYDRVEMNFFIFEGARSVVRSVGIEGARSFPLETLYSLMTLKEGEPFSQDALTHDLETLNELYQSSGFMDFSVKEVAKVFTDKKKQSDIDIIIYLDEGKQSIVQDIQFVGNTFFSEQDIKEALSLKEGKPYNEGLARDGRFIIKKLYDDEGFSDAAVKMEFSQGEKDFNITYLIDEGKQYKVGKIIITGNEITQRATIDREVSFKEGDIYREREIIKTRNRIQRLGIFNEVSLTSHEAEDNIKDIIISLKEGKRGVVELGFGYGEYEHFGAFFDVRYKNLWGENKEVGLTTEIDRIEKLYGLYYKQPYIFDYDLPFTATVEGGRKEALDDDNGDETLYKVDRFSLLLGVEKDIIKNLTWGLDYEYAFVDTRQIDPDVILSKEDTGTTAIGSISPSLIYDTRNNRFDPSKGLYSTCILEVASTPLLSQNDFLKLTLNTSTYYNFIKDSVFAFSLRGGIADSYADTETLPIVERFFLGGRTTVRGYKKNNLGPKVNENPTGGNAFAMFNAEIRVPIKWGLGIVTFVDGGNVWQEIEDIDEDRRLRYTTGAGLRYNTPVGPLSIDYGRKLSRDDKSNESHGELHFSIGHAF